MNYQPESYLADQLAANAQLWVQEFREYWGLDDDLPPESIETDDWESARFVDLLSSEIVKAARTLERPLSDPGKALDTYFERFREPLTEHPLFRQALEAHLANDIADELERMSAHAICLLDYLVSVKHERARAYLARVGACYLRGLDTETVVMAGAVLDAAMQETFDDQRVRDGGIRVGRYVSLGNRIEFAVKAGILSDVEGERAFFITRERNNAIHTAPNVGAEPDDVLYELAKILDVLMIRQGDSI
jgi:hypothetical protein